MIRPIARSLSAAALPLLLLVGSPAAAQTPAGDTPVIGRLPVSPPERFFPEPTAVIVDSYVEGLETVWGLAFARDRRLFITERPGRIRVVSARGQLDDTPWAVVENVAAEGEGGLMGIALHPNFPTDPWVYVMYTARQGDGRVNRVSRFREVGGRGVEEQVLLDNLPAGEYHNGGRLRFGPDGMLYIGAGDAGQRQLAQDAPEPAGSILRIAADGSIPADNPYPNSPVFAYGLRNPQGLAFREDGALFAADHGPTTEWRDQNIGGHDEINQILRGANYGWPRVIGAAGEAGLFDPIIAWDPALPPGDLLFYYGAMPSLNGNLFMTSLGGEALIRIQFRDPRTPSRITAVERWFNSAEGGESAYGRLRAMTIGPDGALYVGTSNHDGRGTPRDDDDQVLRIAPPPF